ncbi:hypothetical protein [Streptomyces flavofungini]|uniref:Uncharacterized protein n=1 Tax=Streptomyces flavofungini TaxID=68200 RepID=A0ABS0XBE9_9ACTN|nr:hypothetical protein [Streptomyces flavofungini]MBJ3810533.1 hypothetical protein [Streptomyces flavofungini]GHC84104.1 hypothetical protein GCM10010349_68860 [Streptomyces flavofungini]
MPRLGEVLGGLLTDVLRARLAADALTAQALEAYREDPVLASFSVPRVAVADLTVRLRFLVTGVEVPEPSRPDRVRASRVWNAIVRDQVLPRLSTSHPDAGLDEVVRLLQDAVRRNPVGVGERELDRAVDGDTAPLVDSTLVQVAEQVDGLPPAARARLARIRWEEEVQRELALRAGPFAERVRQWAAAEQALRSRVEVEVSADRLQERAAETLQQVELTVALADVEEFVDLATRTEP